MNRFLKRLFITYAIIAFTIWICEFVSFWFYPIAVVVLGNQYYCLALLGHEGIHGILHKNITINRILGRYFCHFPIFISLSHYGMNHLRHHRNLGTNEDPDLKIYENAYPSIASWVGQSIKNILTLKTIFYFINYFNGGIDFLRGRYPFKMKTDLPHFFVYWFFIGVFVFSTGIYIELLMYLTVPVIILLPWFFVGNLYQHYSEPGENRSVTYTILFKNKWIQELLFPLNLNYHEVHHRHPDIPYYLLPNHSEPHGPDHLIGNSHGHLFISLMTIGPH